MSDSDRTAPDPEAVHYLSVRYIVTGRVQGVGFRMFTQRAGRQLGLDGIVRNLHNGSVECVVRYPAGSAQLRASFEDRLHTGPPHSRVDQIEIQDPASTGPVGFIGRGFQIL